MERPFALLIALSTLISLVAVSAARAQSSDWKPDKHVELIVPVNPGGSLDRTGRLIQKIWQQKQAVPVPSTVLNKPGGGHAIALAYLSQKAGDGHYLFVSSTTLLSTFVTSKRPLDYTQSFTPIAQLFNEYVVIAVRADSPIRTAKELLQWLQKDPESLVFSVAPVPGTANHLGMIKPLSAAGVNVKKLRTVFFDTSPEAVTSLLGGHVHVTSANPSVVAPHLKAGKVRVLAISAPRRLQGLYAEVPTWKEQGINTTAFNFRGLVGPKGLTDRQVAYWENVIMQVVKSEEWQKELELNHWDEDYRNSKESRKFLQTEYDELKANLLELGLVK